MSRGINLLSPNNEKCVPWQFNCGFARVAVRELSKLRKGASAISLDRNVRATEFQKLFSEVSEFERPVEYASMNSHFNKHCKYINECFSRKWPVQGSKDEYCTFFATSVWKDMELSKKKKHSLCKCTECASEHLNKQKLFPGQPLFELAPTVSSIVQITLPEHTSSSEASVTQQVLEALNTSYESVYNHSFTDSVVKYCGKKEGITKRETPIVKKRNICSAIEDRYGKNKALIFFV